MTEKTNTRNVALLRKLADEAIDDLFSTPPEERRRILDEEYGGAAEAAEEVRNLIADALAADGKARAARVKEDMEATRRGGTRNLRSMSVEEKRALCAQVANANQDLTLAARDGKELTDADLDAYLAAWLKLGLIDEGGNLV